MSMKQKRINEIVAVPNRTSKTHVALKSVIHGDDVQHSINVLQRHTKVPRDEFKPKCEDILETGLCYK
jgi:hypothetical protein